MRLSERWLREWINPSIDTEKLCDQLTMAGLEIERCEPAAEIFSHVIIGHVEKVEPHPDAKKLKVCQVNTGTETLTIVCGASNVTAGIKVPVALVGAVLPGNFEIKEAELRGVKSCGMICASRELGLPDMVDGIWILPDDAPVGKNMREYLALDDVILEVNLTPNRGDCLSVYGIARDLAAVNHLSISEIKSTENAVTTNDCVTVKVKESEACPRYVGRVIKSINSQATTPMWMQERLRRSDIRPISPVVDVLNYVMLEIGQPMHAFDLSTLQGGIEVRFARQEESLVLLNQQTVTFDPSTLVIADQHHALAMAGVMGGLPSSVTNETNDIFLESAFFNPTIIAGKARHYNLQTDSAHRFERGVDFNLPIIAMERATELLLKIAGGKAGPMTEVTAEKHLPVREKISLTLSKVNQRLGVTLTADEVVAILKNLGIKIESQKENAWVVTPPSYRFDILIAEDVIEEIARIYGYNRIPVKKIYVEQQESRPSAKNITEQRIKSFMQDLGYHEAITYSFTAKEAQELINASEKYCELINPISHDMAVMRTSLWSGLLDALKFNLHRQQSRVRFFEIGRRFRLVDGELKQEMVLSGLITGTRFPEQWASKSEKLDFFDAKGDLEKLFHFLKLSEKVEFHPGTHPALHPGQTAEIKLRDQSLGHVGLLHPVVAQSMDIKGNVFLFEMVIDHLLHMSTPAFKSISKFPSIRRDFAFVIAKELQVNDLMKVAKKVMQDWLIDCVLFDLFSGDGIDQDKKSVALGLTLQHPSRTLNDEEVNALTQEFVRTLQSTYGAILRE